MTVRCEPVQIDNPKTLTGRLRLIAQVEREWHRERTLEQATWEPHDWLEWS